MKFPLKRKHIKLVLTSLLNVQSLEGFSSSASTLADYDTFPIGDPQLGGVLLVQVEDVHVLEGGRGAASLLDLRPPPPP